MATRPVTGDQSGRFSWPVYKVTNLNTVNDDSPMIADAVQIRRATVYAINNAAGTFTINVTLSPVGAQGKRVLVGTVTNAAPIMTFEHLGTGVKLVMTAVAGGASVDAYVIPEGVD